MLRAAGVDLGTTVTVDIAELARFEGADGTVTHVVFADGRRESCDTAIVTSPTKAPRDLLARMVSDPHVRVVGPAAQRFDLPPVPVDGFVCPCSKITVGDLQMVWDKGFQHLELVKRATLCGTGTCQGGGVHAAPAFVRQRQQGVEAAPFTARPASRQITIAEAAADVFTSTRSGARRCTTSTSQLGAQMDRFGGWWRPWNYGDAMREYWAVREGVSLGDVTHARQDDRLRARRGRGARAPLPDHVADISPGRCRYVLLLNERGHVIDDGMICRESDDRFVLTFTSGGAAIAEMWVRDWIDTWGLDVHVMDRTMSLGAINVTGPLAGELLRRVGVAEPPKFLQHRHARRWRASPATSCGCRSRARRASSCTTRWRTRSSCGGRSWRPAATWASPRTGCRRCSRCGSRRAT